MKKNQSNTFIKDYTSGKILPALAAFAAPLFLSNLLQAVYNMVDMIVVGHVVGDTGISGISIGGDVLTFLTFVAIGFSNASQVIISQYIGAGLKDRLSRYIGTMFSFLLSCAVCISVVCLFLRGHILSWMNTPEESWSQAVAYCTTCMVGLVFIYGYNAVSAVLRGMGDSRRPFVFIAIAAILNLLLDLLFVVVFRWEAFGAAFATVIAQGTSFVSALVYLYRNRERFGFDFRLGSFRIDPAELSTLIKLGVPMAIRNGSVLFSKLFINSWVNSYGLTVSAVYGVGHKLDNICNMIATSISTAGSSMIAQNIGAGKHGRVSRILGVTYALVISCFSVILLVFAFFPKVVFGIFTQDVQLLEACMEYVPVALVIFTSSCMRAPMNAFTNGCGNYKFNFCVAILDGVVARIGFSLLFGLACGLGYFGFWMGNAVAGYTPFVLGGIYYLSGRWKKKSAIISK